MTTEELIKSLRICSDFTNSKTCADCHFQECNSSCLSRLLTNAADRLAELAAALKMAREENTALIADIEYMSNDCSGDACFICKFYDPGNNVCVCAEHCIGDKWEWRGVMPHGD